MITQIEDLGENHKKFGRALKYGQRVWRDDQLNGKKEWIHLGHPDIAGDPTQIKKFGWNGLSIKTAPEDREPLRKKLDPEIIDAMISAYQLPEEPIGEEIQALRKDLEACHPVEFVRALNMNPELREATDRRVDAPTYYLMKRGFPGAAVIAYSPLHLPTGALSNKDLQDTRKIDGEIDEMLEKLPTFKFLDLVHKTAAYLSEEQLQKACVREPLAVLHLTAEHLPSEIFIRTFQAAKEQLLELQHSKERSAIFSLNEMAEDLGMPENEVYLPSNKNVVFKTEEAKAHAIKTNPGQALYAQLAMDPKHPHHKTLTPEELEHCAILRPDIALKLASTIKRDRSTGKPGVSTEGFDRCAQTNNRTRDYAISRVPHLLSPQNLLRCAKTRQETTLKTLEGERPPRALLHALYTVMDNLPHNIKEATSKAVLASLEPGKGRGAPRAIEPAV
jgi:hypothetical protein